MAKAKKSIKSRFRLFTALASIFGSLSLLSLVTVLVLAESNVIDIFSDNVRSYKAEFYDDGVFLGEQILERGQKIEAPEPPKFEIKELDGSISVFLGWDITGEGIPDTLPTNAYFNFSANTVYFNIPGDAIPYDMLMELFENGLLDLEKFLPEGGFDQDMLEDLFKNAPTVFTFTSDYNCAGYQAPMHFRVCSYGDYDAGKGKWKNAPTYPKSKISSGSVNPLEFAADKCNNAARLIGTPGTFETTIKMEKKGGKYPTFGYELGNTQNLDSDSYSYTSIPSNLTYTVTSNEFFTTATTIDTAKAVPFSNSAIASDEKAYRDYVLSNYMKVDSKYNDALSRVITDGHFKEFNFNNPDSNEIIEINNYISTNFKYTLTKPRVPGGQDILNYFLKDGKEGMGPEFASAATLLYRKLGLPARYVEGYYSFNSTPGEPVEVKTMFATFWTEVYVSNVGWVIIDPVMVPMSIAFGLVDKGMLEQMGFGSNLDQRDFNPDPSISNQGPGKGETDDVIAFTFASSQKSGPAYFKTTTYDSIDGSRVSRSSTLDMIPYQMSGITTSPTLYTSYAADGLSTFFPKYEYNIELKQNFKGNAPWPLYSDMDNRGATITDQYQSGPAKQGDKLSASSIAIFEPTETNLDRLRDNLYTNFPDIYDENMAYGRLIANNFYLTIKPEYQQYFTQFAEENNITADDPDVYRKVRDAVKYHATYNISFKAYPAGADPILYFMQTAREGICNNYASATVMMFRALGIPARYVTGFLGVATSSPTNNVTNSRFHAWTEVWVDGVGWVDLDSTGLAGPGGGGDPEPTLGWITLDYGDTFESTGGGQMLTMSKEYDAQPFNVSLTPISGLLNTHQLRVSVPEWTKFGVNSDDYLTIRIFDGTKDVTKRYDGVELIGINGNAKYSVSGGEIKCRMTGTIDPRPLTIITPDREYSYSETRGQAMSCHMGDETVYGLADGDRITQLIYNSSITTVATVANSVDGSSLIIKNRNGENVTNCYSVGYSFGNLIMRR